MQATTSVDIDHLRTWIGKTEKHYDRINPVPVAALSATLDRDDPSPEIGTELPPAWHWLYFLPICRQSELGVDGHPKRGGFLPPVSLPRRMWAGSRLEFHHPLRVGNEVTRTSRILDVKYKEGRSGPLVFVTVQHDVSNAKGIAVTEWQDLVYRDFESESFSAPAPQAAPAEADWRREITPDPTLLFRYSALTFNSHRIHYDRRYAMEVEGYPGLVMHGPIQATLALDLLRCSLPDEQLLQFTFRGIRPLNDTAPFLVCGKRAADGKTVHLWTQDANGWQSMEATAVLE